MFPEPFSFIGIHFIRSYGIMLSISFLLGTFLALKRAKNAGIKEELVLDLAFIVLIAALIGSRLFYVVYHLDEFSNNIFNVINPFQADSFGISGLSMMGGVVLALIAAFVFFRFHREETWKLCDIMMPMFALGVGITRIGCFLNGCCYGLPSHSSCGVVFPPESAAGYYFPNTPLIPTQLYESAAGFVMLAVVLWSERYKKFDGHSFWITIGLYSLWRFVIDFFRYYEQSMVFTTIGGQNISRNQAISILFFVASIIAYLVMYSRYENKAGASAESGH